MYIIQLKSGLMAAGLPHEERQDASQPTSLPLKTEQTVQTQHLSPTVAEGEEEHEEMVRMRITAVCVPYVLHHGTVHPLSFLFLIHYSLTKS